MEHRVGYVRGSARLLAISRHRQRLGPLQHQRGAVIAAREMPRQLAVMLSQAVHRLIDRWLLRPGNDRRAVWPLRRIDVRHHPAKSMSTFIASALPSTPPTPHRGGLQVMIHPTHADSKGIRTSRVLWLFQCTCG